MRARIPHGAPIFMNIVPSSGGFITTVLNRIGLPVKLFFSSYDEAVAGGNKENRIQGNIGKVKDINPDRYGWWPRRVVEDYTIRWHCQGGTDYRYMEGWMINQFNIFLDAVGPDLVKVWDRLSNACK
jgi:hypothetical protein